MQIKRQQSEPDMEKWTSLKLGKEYIKAVYCHPGLFNFYAESVQFSSVAQLCPILCDPMNHRVPGLRVHHQLPEFTQTQVHQVSDAIQPSHPLSSPSPPRMRWPKYWSFSFSIIPSNLYLIPNIRTDSK